MSKWLKNEEGSGLVLAIMTLLVLFVLGLSIGTITISGHRMSHTNRDSISAYYIAEAGANLAYEDMKSIVEEMYNPDINQDTFFGSIEEKFENEIILYKEFKTQFGYQPKANINIVPPDDDANPRVYTIESVSNIGNHSRTAQKEVKVNWVGNEDGGGKLPFLPENVSLFANSGISFTNGQIIGDVYLNSLEPNSFLISNSGSVSSNTSNIYVPGADFRQIYTTTGGNPPLNSFISRTKPASETIAWEHFENLIKLFPEFPNFPLLKNKTIRQNNNTHRVHANGNLNITNYLANGYIWNLDGDVSVNTLSITENNVLNVDTQGQSFSIVVNHLNVSNGHININGGGTIKIYVKDEITMGSGSKINENGNHSNLEIYYQGGELVDMGGSQHINGSIFVKRANIDIGSGASIRGTILSGGDEVKFSGGTHSETFLIAPSAKLSLQDGANVEGITVVDQITLNGGTELKYKYYPVDTFPFGGSAPSNSPNPSIDDLIEAEPTKEP